MQHSRVWLWMEGLWHSNTFSWRSYSVRGRGGGHFGIYKVAYAHFQNLKIPLNYWFQARKGPLFSETLTFFTVNNTPSFIKTLTLDERILTLDFIILCLISSSRLGSLVTSGVTRRHSRGYFVDCKGILSPHTSYLGTKICNVGEAPLYTWLHPPPTPPPGSEVLQDLICNYKGRNSAKNTVWYQ